MNTANGIRRLSVILGILACIAVAHGQKPRYEGDVTDVRTIRRVEQHPLAWRLWQPYIIESTREGRLIVAFGAMRLGKKDMGDILATVSKDDGDTWQEAVPIFDHSVRQGAIQYAYANPVLYRVPGQKIIWCYAMRCPIAYKNSEESQLVAAFTADGGYSWTPVELSVKYTGPLITNAGIVETVIDGEKRYLLPRCAIRSSGPAASGVRRGLSTTPGSRTPIPRSPRSRQAIFGLFGIVARRILLGLTFTSES